MPHLISTCLVWFYLNSVSGGCKVSHCCCVVPIVYLANIYILLFTRLRLINQSTNKLPTYLQICRGVACFCRVELVSLFLEQNYSQVTQLTKCRLSTPSHFSRAVQELLFCWCCLLVPLLLRAWVALTRGPATATPETELSRASVASEQAFANNVDGVAVARKVADAWLGLGIVLGLGLGLGLELEVARAWLLLPLHYRYITVTLPLQRAWLLLPIGLEAWRRRQCVPV